MSDHMAIVPRGQLQAIHDELTCWQSSIAKALRKLLDAPAEDVRAVVEPAAYLRQDDSAHNNLIVCAFTDPGAFKVYRGLQRPGEQS